MNNYPSIQSNHNLTSVSSLSLSLSLSRNKFWHSLLSNRFQLIGFFIFLKLKSRKITSKVERSVKIKC